jgi:hypothetical protein
MLACRSPCRVRELKRPTCRLLTGLPPKPPPNGHSRYQCRGILSSSSPRPFGGAAVALAHAHLVRAVPAAGASVDTTPVKVTLRFSEKLESAFSSVVVHDAAGKQVDKGDATVDKKDRTIIRVSSPNLELLATASIIQLLLEGGQTRKPERTQRD